MSEEFTKKMQEWENKKRRGMLTKGKKVLLNK